MFHISKAPSRSKILAKANDTDVLIILLGIMYKIPNMEIWLASTISKKDQNCINCTKLSSKLGVTLCLALPAIHAFYNKYKVAFQSIIKKYDFSNNFRFH